MLRSFNLVQNLAVPSRHPSTAGQERMQALGWVHLLVTAAFTCWGVACLAVGVAQLGGCPRQPRLPLWLILQVGERVRPSTK